MLHQACTPSALTAFEAVVPLQYFLETLQEARQSFDRCRKFVHDRLFQIISGQNPEALPEVPFEIVGPLKRTSL